MPASELLWMWAWIGLAAIASVVASVVVYSLTGFEHGAFTAALFFISLFTIMGRKF